MSDDVTVGPRPSAAADDFQSVLAAVTGRVVDLRAAADPPGGFLKLGDPGADPWWSFSAFGTDLFSVELNTAALDAWATAIDTVEDLDHELFAGTCGWMNVTQLRTAAARARAEQSSPEVADALDDAAEALSAFGQQMAHIYWESNKVLLNAVAIGANGISQNMQAYLRRAVMNRVRDELRKTTAQPRRTDLPASAPADGLSPLEEAAGKETFDAYQAALATLDEVEREAVIARLELGCSYAEIAALVDKPSVDAARMMVSRALDRIARLMPARV